MAEKKTRLGRGLEVLLGEKAQQLVSSPSIGSSGSSSTASQEASLLHESLRDIALNEIFPGKYQPRHDFDQSSLAELADSIRAQGVIQPIVVRTQEGGRYEIIAGERRWRAAKLAGLMSIPAIVRELPDEAAIAVALIENIQRENLNALEEAVAIQRLIEEFGLTHQEVANALGKSRSNISNILRLLSLQPEVGEMLSQGKIDMGHARALLSLEKPLQYKAAMIVITKGLSVRQTETLVQSLLNSKENLTESKPAPAKEVDSDKHFDLEQQIARKIQLPLSIKPNTKGGGKLIIQYKHIRELERILNNLE